MQHTQWYPWYSEFWSVMFLWHGTLDYTSSHRRQVIYSRCLAIPYSHSGVYWHPQSEKDDNITLLFCLSASTERLHHQTGLKFKDETCEVLHLEHRFVCCWNVDTSESRSEISGKFWNVVLQKDGEDQLDRMHVKWISITQSKRRGIPYIQ
jgi:hypothetical protein